MSHKTLEGVLEAIGPGQAAGGWTLAQYVDIGGRRVSTIGYSDQMGYQLEKALGKNVRLAVYGGGAGGLVAAIETDTGVVKEQKRMPVNSAQTVVALMYGIGAFGLIGGIVGLAGGGPLGFTLAGAFCSSGAVLSFLTNMGAKNGFDAAKGKLDKR